MQLDAKSALVTMGFRPHEAKDAISHAMSHAGSRANFDTFMKTCLRYCPK